MNCGGSQFTFLILYELQVPIPSEDLIRQAVYFLILATVH